MSAQSLQEKLDAAASTTTLLRNSPTGFYVFPVPDEHSNWRDEQRAWQETAVLFDQSYHMTDVYLRGPDRLKLLASISINNYERFTPMSAMQFVAVAHNGCIIGDAIAFHLPDDSVHVVGKPAAANWITFVAETGDYDVEVTRDIRVLESDDARLTYRFQLQGPNAEEILENVNGGPLPDTRFFGMCEFQIAGHQALGLRHGMAGAPGLEFWGPYREREAVLEAILEAGQRHGLLRGGGRTYSTSGPQSGWVGAVLPAIYTDDALRAYREWLPAEGYEAMLSVGGSYVRENIADYYLDPWDVGYHRLIHWEHEFVGRDALLKKRDEPHRRKIWLRWNEDDVARIQASWSGADTQYKFLEAPAAHYATVPYDEVSVDGRPVGISVYAAYTVNARSWFSIGILAEDCIEFGNEANITWGEPEGVTGKLTVEPHEQTTIRATIAKSALG